MITTYTDLIQSVKAWSARTDIDSVIDDIILLSEVRLNSDLMVQELQKNIVIQSPYILPDDFHKIISVKTSQRVLDYMTIDQYERHNLILPSGSPQYYTISNNQILCSPSQLTDITVTYIKRIPGLSNTNPTNEILTKYPTLYLRTCLLYVAEFSHDVEKLVGYESAYANDISKVNQTAWGNASSTLVIRNIE